MKALWHEIFMLFLFFSMVRRVLGFASCGVWSHCSHRLQELWSQSSPCLAVWSPLFLAYEVVVSIVASSLLTQSRISLSQGESTAESFQRIPTLDLHLRTLYFPTSSPHLGIQLPSNLILNILLFLRTGQHWKILSNSRFSVRIP